MQIVWIVFLFAVGACVGSFLNVVIYRLPRAQSIVHPPSRCPHCGKPIAWYDNIPMLSWLVLRARCRRCGGPISGRYPLIELITAVVFAGLFVAYFLGHVRVGLGGFARDWPVYVSHVVLLGGLLAASAVDIELTIVPLQVMWFCSGVGIVAAAASAPAPSLMPRAGPATAALTVAAAIGLAVGELLLRTGLIKPSFADVEDLPAPAAPDAAGGEGGAGDEPAKGGKAARPTVGITSADGVNVRLEILRELVYLAPAIVLGGVAWLVVRHVPAVEDALAGLLSADSRVGPHLAAGLGAGFGMLIGAAWIWGTRIAGSLAFGKEAMGMGDVHILAAVGAAAGWKVASLTFFAAPIFGLGWALYLAVRSGRRELPYGPWLALAAGAMLVLYDTIANLLFPFR